MIQVADHYNARAQAKGWASFCDSTLSFDCQDFHRLVGLWREFRGDALLPARQAMTARLLKDFLPDLALYERLQAQDGPRHLCRLMGTRVTQVYGEHTGKVMQDYLAPQHVERFCSGLDDALAACVPLRFLARTDSANTDFLSAEFCLLPLADAQGNASMVMLGVSFSGESWEEYLARMMAQLGQPKSLASAARASELSTAM